MTYKDKDKQRRANRERQRRYKERHKTESNNAPKVTPKFFSKEQGRRGKDIKCFEDLPPDVQKTINRTSTSPEEKNRRTAIAIHYQHLYPGRYEPNSDQDFTRLLATLPPGSPAVRVSKPGDEDYTPQCETTKTWVEQHCGVFKK